MIKRVGMVVLSILGLLIFSTVETRSASLPTELLNRFLTVDSVVTIIDGQLHISTEAISTLESQIKETQAVSYQSIDYKQDDYAITVGALVGTGDRIEEELSNIVKKGEVRQDELLSLNEEDRELAQTETAYAMTYRAAGEYEKIFGELLEKGYGGIDRLLGSPIFNNWLTLYDEILPLLARRSGEIRRIRKELDRRRTQLHKHNHNAAGWLGDLKKHLDRVREKKAVEALLTKDPSETDFLSKIDRGRQNVAALQNDLVRTNEGVRQEAKRIFEQQRAAYRRAQWLNNVLRVFQIGFSAATATPGTGNASVSPTGNGDISVKIENNTTIINFPIQEMVPPNQPEIILP